MTREEMRQPIESAEEMVADEEVEADDDDDEDYEQEQWRWAIAESQKYARGEGDDLVESVPSRRTRRSSPLYVSATDPLPSPFGFEHSTPPLDPWASTSASRPRRVRSSFQEVDELRVKEKRGEERALKESGDAKKTTEPSSRRRKRIEELEDEARNKSSDEARRRKPKSKKQQKQKCRKKQSEKNAPETSAEKISDDPTLAAARPARRPPPKLYMAPAELRKMSLADIEAKQKDKDDSAFKHPSTDPRVRYKRVINRTDGHDSSRPAKRRFQYLTDDTVYGELPKVWEGREEQNRKPFDPPGPTRTTVTSGSSSNHQFVDRRDQSDRERRPVGTSVAILRKIDSDSAKEQAVDGSSKHREDREYADNELFFDLSGSDTSRPSETRIGQASTDEAAHLMPPPPAPKQYKFPVSRRFQSTARIASPAPKSLIPPRISSQPTATPPSSSLMIPRDASAPTTPISPHIYSQHAAASPSSSLVSQLVGLAPIAPMPMQSVSRAHQRAGASLTSPSSASWPVMPKPVAPTTAKYSSAVRQSSNASPYPSFTSPQDFISSVPPMSTYNRPIDHQSVPILSSTQQSSFFMQIPARNTSTLQEASSQIEGTGSATSATQQGQRAVKQPVQSQGQQPDWVGSEWMPKDDSDEDI